MAAVPESGDSARFDEIIARFENAWRIGEPPSLTEFIAEAAGEADAASLIEALVLTDLEWHWRTKAEQPPKLEDYATRIDAIGPIDRVEMITEEYRARHNWGDQPTHDEYQERFPHVWEPLSSALDQIDQELAKEMRQQSPQVQDRLGRYKILRRVGSGGFGIVYQARDEELSRDVAIKVPYRERIATPADAEQFMTEARTIAGLDHPSVVPVYDVGRTEDDIFYVVTKFIDGDELTAKIATGFRSFRELSAIVASVADGLHHAHLRGITHRDVKPANILLDSAGKAFVTDFGLAVRDADVALDQEIAGTPAYMSPEQARGEGHRVDGRTDIFSLGVVLYELLAGRKPFRGDSAREVLELVKHVEPRPPRQFNDTIPRELERICLKALSKRISDRYPTCGDMAKDLRQWQTSDTERMGKVSNTLRSVVPENLPERRPSTDKRDVTIREVLPRVVPKGLRSFDAADADFFLELLPGPRSRDGLPDSIRFWKTRIESTTPENSFTVGMLYGPSGCGKSSLIKAGILPRLAGHVETVYVEATPGETEVRLATAIQSRAPTIPPQASLPEAISILRKGGLANGRKLFLVIDQFEQWLHAHSSPNGELLVDALRQCDGTNVQCLLLVRDDFWLSSCRFMEALEIDLVPDQNVAIADLFDKLHATAVLTRFGRAYGRLPQGEAALSRKQIAFVEAAVDGLARDERVVCVRLALFADLVKGKLWEPATLKQYGGMHGLGVTFLEESFSSRTAMPKHRLHEKGARAVLRSLLPTHGADIKGAMRSREQILKLSGYATNGADFDGLLRILDSDLRLITPTDASESDAAEMEIDPSHGSTQVARESAKHYQLTHDYLVPSLREWLMRKQRQSARGRAELRLAEQAAIWNERQTTRNLLSLWEWANVHSLTRPKEWSLPERQMMSAAARFYGIRAALLAILVSLAACGGYEFYGQSRARTMVDRLLVAELGEVPSIVRDLKGYRRWAEPILRTKRSQADETGDTATQLRSALASLAVDDTQVDYLIEMLRNAGQRERMVICDALSRRSGPRATNSATLVDLVLDADPDEFQLLMPVVRAQANRAEPFVAFLETSLARGRRQQPEAIAPLPNKELVQRIERADGMVSQQSAFCQKMPIAEAFETIDQLREAGYRPVRFRPFQSLDQTLVAVAWQRDGRDWRMEADQTADEVQTLNDQLQQEGFLPDELIGRLDEELNERYTCIWVKGVGEQARTITIGVNNREHRTLAANWIRTRFRAIRYHAFMLADGTIRSSAIREYTERSAHEGSYCGSEYGDLYPGLLQTDIQVLHLPWDHVRRTDAAINRLNEQLNANPSDPRILQNLANRQVVQGDFEQAVKHYSALLDVHKMSDALGLRAHARACSGDREGALEDLTQYFERRVDPMMRSIHSVRVHSALGDESEAIAALEAALMEIEVSSSAVQLANAAAAYSVAYSAALRAKDDDRCKRYAKRASELFEQSIDKGQTRRSFSYRMQAREDPDYDALRALPEFRRMLARRKFDQEYAVAWFNRANIESRTLFDLPPDEHLQACQELRQEGFDIAAVSVDDVGIDEPKLIAASVWHRPVATRESAAQVNSRRANAAIAAYQLGEPKALWSILQHTSRPDLRSFVVNRLQTCRADPHGLVDRLWVETDPSTRRALLLAIGTYSKSEFDAAFVEQVDELFRTDPDPGIHGAAEWLLRRWNVPCPKLERNVVPNQLGHDAQERHSWFVNSQGQTFTVARGPLAFEMGSPSYEVNRGNDELRHEERIARSFAVATNPVTVEQYQQFLDANPTKSSIRWREYSPDPRCPITGATWYQSVEYCNWLSEVEGLEPIYIPNTDGSYSEGMSVHANCLDRNGYRLPTRAEWEYMARAGASTAWSFGDTPLLLPYYAWYAGNSNERSWPVGTLKPNDFGLFDMHGNVLEWLHNAWYADGQGVRRDGGAPIGTVSGLVGGSYRRFPRDSRSAFTRRYIVATTSYVDGGFRLCRTIATE